MSKKLNFADLEGVEHTLQVARDKVVAIRGGLLDSLRTLEMPEVKSTWTPAARSARGDAARATARADKRQQLDALAPLRGEVDAARPRFSRDAILRRQRFAPEPARVPFDLAGRESLPDASTPEQRQAMSRRRNRVMELNSLHTLSDAMSRVMLTNELPAYTDDELLEFAADAAQAGNLAALPYVRREANRRVKTIANESQRARLQVELGRIVDSVALPEADAAEKIFGRIDALFQEIDGVVSAIEGGDDAAVASARISQIGADAYLEERQQQRTADAQRVERLAAELVKIGPASDGETPPASA